MGDMTAPLSSFCLCCRDEFGPMLRRAKGAPNLCYVCAMYDDGEHGVRDMRSEIPVVHFDIAELAEKANASAAQDKTSTV
jgi:hypothetical protein